MQTTNMCKNCSSGERELWAIGPPYPEWETVKSGNFITLFWCRECGQLWAESWYEPFAAFRYAVKWLGAVGHFLAINSENDGKNLCKWHEYQVRLMANEADDTTLAHIRNHYKRSRGYIDLTPSSEPNPITIWPE